MRIKIEFDTIKDRYADSIHEIMSKLKNSTSINKHAKTNKLKWCFDYGHVIKGISFKEIMAGIKVHNPNDIKDAEGRSAAWIKRIPCVMLYGYIGPARFCSSLPEIPHEVKSFELACAKEAIEREKNAIRLTSKEIKSLVTNGLVIFSRGSIDGFSILNKVK